FPTRRSSDLALSGLFLHSSPPRATISSAHEGHEARDGMVGLDPPLARRVRLRLRRRRGGKNALRRGGGTRLVRQGVQRGWRLRGGTHCGSDGKCTAECAAGSASCGPNDVCDAHGRCVPWQRPDGSTDGGECVDVTLNPERIVPNIILLIDQSGSMDVDDVPMGGTTLRRGNAVRELLVGRCNSPSRDPSNGYCTGLVDGSVGVVGRTHEIANYSLVLYTSATGGDYPDECPILRTTPVAASN